MLWGRDNPIESKSKEIMKLNSNNSILEDEIEKKSIEKTKKTT